MGARPTGLTGCTRPRRLGEWVAPVGRLAAEADEVYALFNNNNDDFAPRSAMILRGLLDEAGVPDAHPAAAEQRLDPVPTDLSPGREPLVHEP